MLQPKVSVVIVSYNTAEKLRRCLTQIEREHEVIVVDNASLDDSVAMVAREFPWVKLISNSENVGFGPANNQGAREATGDLVLYLNSDAYADPGSIAKLASVFAEPEVIATGGKLLNPDRTLQLSTANGLNLWAVFCEQTNLEKLFPGSKVFSPYWTTRRLALSDDPSPTPQIMGACLMVRMINGKPLELFDERYFLYCEDTDLCKRLSTHGSLVYVPKATFIHDLGSSSAKDPAMGIIRYNWGKELYFSIHHGRVSAFACWVLDKLGASLRLAAWLAIYLLRLGRDQRSKAQVRAFWRVLTAPRLSGGEVGEFRRTG